MNVAPKARFQNVVEWGRRMGIWGEVWWELEGSDGGGWIPPVVIVESPSDGISSVTTIYDKAGFLV